MGYPAARQQTTVTNGRRIALRQSSQLGVLPLVAAAAPGALRAIGGLFGKHNDYPNGNPNNLTKFDAMLAAAANGDDSNLRGCQQVAAGATLDMGPFAGGWGRPFVVNWGEQTAGRQAERKYMSDGLARLAALRASTPAPAAASAASAGITPASRLVQEVLQLAPIAPATLTLPATVQTTTPAGSSTAPVPAVLQSRSQSPRIRPPTQQASGGGLFAQIAQAVAQLVPQAAPLVNAIAPQQAQPVTVSVTAPTPSSTPRRVGGGGGGSFFAQNKGLIVAGGLGVVALAVLPQLMGRKH